MIAQAVIEFPIHSLENHPVSQDILDNNAGYFSEKCQLVFTWLMEGTRLKVLEAHIAGVSSLPRRILDLKKAGVLITTEYENRIAVYYMTPKQRQDNQKFLINI